MNRSKFWTIKYMNGSIFSKARHMNRVGFEILARSSVSQLPPSYPLIPPPTPHPRGKCVSLDRRYFLFFHRISFYYFLSSSNWIDLGFIILVSERQCLITLVDIAWGHTGRSEINLTPSCNPVALVVHNDSTNFEQWSATHAQTLVHLKLNLDFKCTWCS